MILEPSRERTVREPSEVASMRWYHTIDFPDGTTSPGEFDLRNVAKRLPWPGSMKGMRCIDIGSRDGFYAFEMERRGAAEVVSVDIDSPDQIDFPGRRPADDAIQRELEDGHAAFETARRLLGSSVERRFVSAYNLDPDVIGEFDFGVVGTLLLHLRDPVSALLGARRVIHGSLMLNEPIPVGLDAFRRRPATVQLEIPGPFWTLANPQAHRRRLQSAGFEIERQGRPYLLPNGVGRRALAGPILTRPVRDTAMRLVNRRGMLHAWTLARAS